MQKRNSFGDIFLKINFFGMVLENLELINNYKNKKLTS